MFPMQRSMRRYHLSLLAVLCLGALLAIASQPTASEQQPQSGIDPCSRTIARMATPEVPEVSDPSANRLAVSQTVMNFTSCFNRRSWEGVLLLTNEGFRTSMFGESDGGILSAHLSELDDRGLLPQIRIQSIEENGTTGSTLATLIVTWEGWSGVHQELWRLQVEDGHWVLAGRSIQSPTVNGVAVGIRFEIDQGSLRAPAVTMANPGAVIFAFENRTDQPVRALVLRAGLSANLEQVLSDCNGSGQVSMRPVGEAQVPAGETVSMPMFDLADATYAVIVGERPCAPGVATGAEQIHLLEIVEASDA